MDAVSMPAFFRYVPVYTYRTGSRWILPKGMIPKVDTEKFRLETCSLFFLRFVFTVLFI